MQRIRQRVKAVTSRTVCHRDLRDIIARVNPVLRGWGAYFRTGNAAKKFGQLDDYVHWRLTRLLIKRHGRQLHAGSGFPVDRCFLSPPWSPSPARHDSVPGGGVMLHLECPLVSRVRNVAKSMMWRRSRT
jgi:Group II intron, maturase-specific domain